MSSHAGFVVRLEAVTDIEQSAVLWRELSATAMPSFFQSWDWIGTWLACMPPQERPLLLSAESDGTPRAACLLIRKHQRRRLLLPADTLFINVTGERDYNLNPEYNGILVNESASPDAQTAMLKYLQDELPGWDEIRLPATTAWERQQLADICQALDLRVRTLHQSQVYRVDLHALREGDGDYRKTLSGNARYQLRRAIQRYQQIGEVHLQAAPDRATAHAWFDRLKALHTRRWRQRGMKGTFGKAYWEPFHRRLIDRLFPTGRIQMLRIACGETEIGYLYNIIDGGQILFIQSGFNYAADPHDKPGYVSHTLAIEHNLQAGLDNYNFLAGDERYKRTLATPAESLYWLAIQKPRLRFSIENGLRRLLRTV